MASYQAFNSMMQDFLNELIQTFPEEKSLKVENTKFQTLKKANSKKIVESFMAAISPYTNQISSKDESIFDMNIDFLKKLNIKKLWTKDLSQNTKDAIWQYLNTLIMLGTTITSIPNDMLKQIESVAEQCASQMDSSSESQPNIANIFSGLQSIMGNMNNNNK